MRAAEWAFISHDCILQNLSPFPPVQTVRLFHPLPRRLWPFLLAYTDSASTLVCPSLIQVVLVITFRSLHAVLRFYGLSTATNSLSTLLGSIHLILLIILVEYVSLRAPCCRCSELERCWHCASGALGLLYSTQVSILLGKTLNTSMEK